MIRTRHLLKAVPAIGFFKLSHMDSEKVPAKKTNTIDSINLPKDEDALELTKNNNPGDYSVEKLNARYYLKNTFEKALEKSNITIEEHVRLEPTCEMSLHEFSDQIREIMHEEFLSFNEAVRQLPCENLRYEKKFSIHLTSVEYDSEGKEIIVTFNIPGSMQYAKETLSLPEEERENYLKMLRKLYFDAREKSMQEEEKDEKSSNFRI